MDVSQLIFNLADEIDGLMEKDIRKRMKEILKSYEIQTSYGIPRLEAFSNSLYTTSTRKKQKYRLIELMVKKNELKSRGVKFRQLDRYSHEVLSLYRCGNGFRKISKAMMTIHKFKVSHETIRKYITIEKRRITLEELL